MDNMKYWAVVHYLMGLLFVISGGFVENIYICLSGIACILGGILYVLDMRLK